MSNNRPEIGDLLYLLTIPNIGPGRIRKLFQVFGSRAEIIKAPAQKLVCVEGIDYKLAARIKSGGDTAKAEEQLKLIEKHGVKYVTVWDENYPRLLKRISDPPVVLFYKGKLKAEQKSALAVVGTRTPSNYGKMVTTDIVRQLCERGITIVSGMARGIDAVAHHTAIQSGAETLAVLGCGLDRCYPPENSKLFREIPEHGALISEYFVGVGPDATNFPKRNRIISGLTQGALVVEAGDRSGALITAFYALNYNREVFAIPGNITSPKSNGANSLIKQGAKLVQTADDIFEEIREFAGADTISERPVPENLKEFEKKILSCLSKEPKHIDRLVTELQDSPATILAGLLSLELMGLVQQLAGKMFVRM